MKNIIYLFALVLIVSSCSEDIGSSDGLNPSLFDTSNTQNNNKGDTYEAVGENPFVKVIDQPISTFSIDTDGASYSNMRRFLNQDNVLPPVGAIRTEEFINYFNMDYPFTETDHPISLNGEVSACPWNTDHRLIRVGIKGAPIQESEYPSSNFVFLIDVSGSMSSGDKLELLKEGFKLLVDELDASDRVAIVTYAGASEILLESTPASEKNKIKDAIDMLSSGGGTAGAEGIVTAYDIAETDFIEGGNNRIIIGTDGDFNIGPVSQEALVELIEEKRELGIFLTVLGVGRGNLNDATLEQIADNGNGNYEYLDNVEQLKKVFIYDFDKFFTIAKDVKVQVEFDPTNVESYRLIGYENRLLAEEDFEDDKKDAGELGANQSVTALYEIIPRAIPSFQSFKVSNIDFRYKLPDSDVSVPMSLDIYDNDNSFGQSSPFMKFTASVAGFSMLLTDSDHKGTTSYDDVIDWLDNAHVNDPNGLKSEFERLVEKAKSLE